MNDHYPNITHKDIWSGTEGGLEGSLVAEFACLVMTRRND